VSLFRSMAQGNASRIALRAVRPTGGGCWTEANIMLAVRVSTLHRGGNCSSGRPLLASAEGSLWMQAQLLQRQQGPSRARGLWRPVTGRCPIAVLNRYSSGNRWGDMWDETGS
jgi:hypothetical protein